jgi:hypothetical protein
MQYWTLSNLFRSHRYPPLEKLYSVFLFIAGLSLRDLSERLRSVTFGPQ